MPPAEHCPVQKLQEQQGALVNLLEDFKKSEGVVKQTPPISPGHIQVAPWSYPPWQRQHSLLKITLKTYSSKSSYLTREGWIQPFQPTEGTSAVWPWAAALLSSLPHSHNSHEQQQSCCALQRASSELLYNSAHQHKNHFYWNPASQLHGMQGMRLKGIICFSQARRLDSSDRHRLNMFPTLSE